MLDGNPKMILLEVAALSAVLLLAWKFLRPPEPYLPADVAPQVAHVPTVAVPMAAPIRVYAPAAKAKLNLPAAIVAAPNKHVAAATRIKPDQHPQTVVTVVDTSTGDVETITRKEPLPWIAREHTGELQLSAGIKNGMARVGRISLREDLLQIKSFHLGAQASLDTDGQYFVGAGVGWKW